MAASGGRFDLDRLGELVAADPGGAEFPALAEALRRAGDADRARRVAEQGLARSPGRLAGRVALGLALLDLGRTEAARAALAEILEPALDAQRAPGVGSVRDDELDRAFALAEPQVDEMISPNRMAERVLLDHAPHVEDVLANADEDLLEATGDAFFTASGDDPLSAEQDDDGLALDVDEPSSGSGFDAPSPLFRTATMAELLARQGDAAGAEAIRRELARDTAAAPRGRGVDAAEVPERPPRARVAPAGAQRVRILATLERWLQNIQRGDA